MASCNRSLRMRKKIMSYFPALNYIQYERLINRSNKFLFTSFSTFPFYFFKINKKIKSKLQSGHFFATITPIIIFLFVR